MMLSPDLPDTAQDCYTMAYFVLPQYVTREAATFIENLARSPTLGAGFYYVMACQMNGKEPDVELLRSFPVHLGDLDETYRYCVVEYPTPQRSWSSLEEMIELGDQVVLAPYFSGITLNKQSAEAQYFVLGQSPEGHTTLRCVTQGTKSFMNANLGPGCDPELEEFISLLRQQTTDPKAGD